MSISQSDLNQLQARIDAGDRAGLYILYHNMTGSNEALIQAQISSYSGALGQFAAYSNAAAKAILGNQYPETTDQFSLAIATDLLDQIRYDVTNGGTGDYGDYGDSALN